jgi:hypothetical protein
MRDYRGELSTAFERAAERQPGTVTKRDIDEVTNVAEQWTSSNFTDNLMPALAIFIARKKQLDPEIPTAEITTPELFNDAVDFIISNGAFRNFVTVPAEIAADGQERVNHFLCPAVGTIRDQLLDGSLLHTVHRATVARIEAGDSSALGLREHIQTRAQESLLRIAEDEKWQRQQAMEAARPFVPIETQGKTWADIACDAIAQTTARQKPALFNFEGQEYRVVLDQEWSGLVAHEPKQQGDTEIELRAGDVLYNVLGTSAATALQTEGDVFFSFNGDPYRITCANVQALFQNSIIQ